MAQVRSKKEGGRELMIPFDECWIHQVEKRYGSKPVWEQPDTYRFATSAKMSAARSFVNRFVESLPDKAQKRFVSNLREEASFSNAFHEVMVGAMLAQNGPIPGYEPELVIGGKTPDWYVAPRGGGIACHVEVFSRNTRDGRKDNSFNELILRLKRIPGQTVLAVQSASDSANILLTNTPKKIASDVRKWLESPGVAHQSTMERGGVAFTVLPRKSSSGTVQIIPLSAITFWVNSKPLNRLIAEKAGKYRSSCNNGQTALVVAIVADPVTGLDTEELESVLCGSVKCPIVFDETTKRPLPGQPYRANDGIFDHYPGLNAVAWVEENGPNTWISTLYENPACNLLLPDQVLKGLRSTMTIAGKT